MKFYDAAGNIYEKPEDREVFFRPGVYSLVRKDDKFLLIKDSKSNNWEFPGGGLDICETFKNGVIRETKEETGYDIDLISENPIITSMVFDYFRRQDKYCHCIDMLFICYLKNDIQGEQNFDVGENIEEVRWFTLDEIKKLETVNFQKRFFEEFEKYI